MSDVQVSFRGEALIKPNASQAPSGSPQAGTTIPFSLRSQNQTASGEISQVCQTISSPSAFAALPFPSNLTARVLMIQTIGTAGPFSLRLTQAGAGQTTIAGFRGMLALEVDEGEEITAVELQGEGDITWAATGPTT